MTGWAGDEAGRNLDGIVARKVMGYYVYHYDKGHARDNYFMLMDSEGEPVADVLSGGYREFQRTYESDAWDDCPAFSTDIAAAWIVMEWLRLHGYQPDLSVEDDNATWLCTTRIEAGRYLFEKASTAPLSICRAALRTVA